MNSNVGMADRIIRVAIALLASILFFTHLITGTFGIILLVLSGILLITSIAGTCPLYMLPGLSTNKKQVNRRLN
jgi:hypothetical protein